ncbi:helix-turn-helix domain-containing protein [Streptococcus sp. H31]|uniref:helix-turn-helix domain-containing protein n=1 Tax=Streptococcus huangxiaojuni TaxID=3237239 RepID=UPI0034A2A9A6
MNQAIKEGIGRRIRQAREERGLTREEFCGTEDELTVRQLQRIELGKSQPSLLKLDYIAGVLNVDLTALLAGDGMLLPDSYFRMKYRLFKIPSYSDPQRLDEKIQLIETIYDHYFNLLPEEELFTLDLLDNIFDYLRKGQRPAAEDSFAEAFKELLLKPRYSLNDLLLAKYYLIQHHSGAYNKALVQKMETRALKQEISGDEYYNLELINFFSDLSALYTSHAEYPKLDVPVKRMHDLIRETRQDSMIPLTLMFEAKYYIYVKQCRTKAEELYNAAVWLAESFDDVLLKRKLIHERNGDRV